jgi:hypothetical protein
MHESLAGTSAIRELTHGLKPVRQLNCSRRIMKDLVLIPNLNPVFIRGLQSPGGIRLV